MAAGTWDVEIIVPTPGGGRTIYSEYLEQPPAGGLHHIGAYLAADQYDAAYRYLEGLGYAQIQGGPILGIDRNGRFDYFESDAQLGTAALVVRKVTSEPVGVSFHRLRTC